jgi:hypothetical protein
MFCWLLTREMVCESGVVQNDMRYVRFAIAPYTITPLFNVSLKITTSLQYLLDVILSYQWDGLSKAIRHAVRLMFAFLYSHF